MSDTPNNTPAATPSSSPFAAGPRLRHRHPDQRGTERKDAALHRDERRQRVVTRHAGVRPAGDRNPREPERGDDHPGPLSTAEVKAEVALSQHPEKHQPARQHGLYNRQWRERKRADMEAPGGNRHRPPQRKPAGAKQIHGAAQWMTSLHGRRQHRTTLLEQEGDIRAQRRAQRQSQPGDHRLAFLTTAQQGAALWRSSRCSGSRRPACRLRCLAQQRRCEPANVGEEALVGCLARVGET